MDRVVVRINKKFAGNNGGVMAAVAVARSWQDHAAGAVIGAMILIRYFVNMTDAAGCHS